MKMVPDVTIVPIAKQIMEAKVSETTKKYMAESVKTTKAAAKRVKKSNEDKSKEEAEESLSKLESVYNTMVSKGVINDISKDDSDANMSTFILSLNESISSLRKALV
jgi:ribosomal protein S20